MSTVARIGLHDTVEELEIAPLPDPLLGTASTRVAEAAQALGQDWQPQAKFLRPTRSPGFDCGARCMLGCRCGAKWNAAEYVDEAVAGGAELRTRARVHRALIEDAHVVGVEGRLGGKPFTARAETVVLAAGGIGTPRILHASGLTEAGVGMAMDATVMVYGFIPEEGIGREPPMTWSWENPEAGYMLSTLVDPWLLYPLMAGLRGVRYAMTWPRWRNVLGVMRTEVEGLYVCDASTFPEALGRPTVLTIVGLARRLAKHLAAGQGHPSRTG